MNEIIRVVPNDIKYISQWSDFEKILPPHHCILDKGKTGCGLTSWMLTVNPYPTVLASPRKELLHCKLNDYPDLFYYSKENPSVDISARVSEYLAKAFHPYGFIPRILVTYDSLPDVLAELEHHGILNQFLIAVDEFTTGLFSDSTFKGHTELQALQALDYCGMNRVVYISATVPPMKYLNMVGLLNKMPIVRLKWFANQPKTIVVRSVKQSVEAEITRIVQNFINEGYFKSMPSPNGNGAEIYSDEGVFFVNSVVIIAKVAKKFDLTDANTRVICGDSPENARRLKKVGLSIGQLPSRKNYASQKKNFTFVTRAAFDGADFYSDCSTTFVFSDVNKDNLAIDLAIDLPQICGRCRFDHPFSHRVYFYYKINLYSDKKINELNKSVDDRYNATTYLLNRNANEKDPLTLDVWKRAQAADRYQFNYVDVVNDYNGQPMLTGNALAYAGQSRHIDIIESQYSSPKAIELAITNAGLIVAGPSPDIKAFCQQFSSTQNFEVLMRLYCELADRMPESLESISDFVDIPSEIKIAHEKLGSARIRSLSYKHSNIAVEMSNRVVETQIISALKMNLEIGHKYTLEQLKPILQQAFNSVGYNATAKGSQIQKYCIIETTKIQTPNGKRKDGVKIIAFRTIPSNP